jgi:tetratricopeptide (TPR) repeat protein
LCSGGPGAKIGDKILAYTRAFRPGRDGEMICLGMPRHKKFKDWGFSIALVLFFSMAGLASAEVVTFEEEYTYQASEYDSKVSCRALALEQVKRLLLERLGIYLESETQIKNSQLSKEQIVLLTAGVVSAEILDERWDGKSYYLKARIAVDPQEVARSIENLRQDRQKTKELEESRKKADELLKEAERLKRELEIARGGKQGPLSAFEWRNRAYLLALSGDQTGAVEAYSRVIELNPEDALAFYNRGTCYIRLRSYWQAIKDFNRAIELNPKLAEAYSNRGGAYYKLGEHRQAFADLKIAAGLGHKPAQDYLRSRGVSW